MSQPQATPRSASAAASASVCVCVCICVYACVRYVTNICAGSFVFSRSHSLCGFVCFVVHTGSAFGRDVSLAIDASTGKYWSRRRRSRRRRRRSRSLTLCVFHAVLSFCAAFCTHALVGCVAAVTSSANASSATHRVWRNAHAHPELYMCMCVCV